MHFFTSKAAKHKIEFKTLKDCEEYALLAAEWTEGEWGYIRNKGVEYRKELLLSFKENFYIGFYAGVPVAMFALLPTEFEALDASKSKIAELMYVYVDKEARGLGFGNQIVNEAKAIAQQQNLAFISFDTLKPNLNRFYENHGAQLIGQGRLFTEPTDIFRMSI